MNRSASACGRGLAARRLYTLRPEPFLQLEAWVRRYASDEMARQRRLSELLDERPPKRRRR